MLQDLAIPILPSLSLEQTRTFYGQLGFVSDVWEAPYHYAILERGSLEIHFFWHRELVPEASCAGCYMRVQNVDELYSELAKVELPRSGIPRMDPLEDKPWGMREFAIVDPNGNLIRIGQAL